MRPRHEYTLCRRSCTNGRWLMMAVALMMYSTSCMTRRFLSLRGVGCGATRVHELPESMGWHLARLSLVLRRCLAGCEKISKPAGMCLNGCGRRRSPKQAGRYASWGSRRFLHRARSFRPSLVSDSVVVVHPFHPLAGQRLVVLFERRRGVEVVVVCEGGPAGRVTVPVSWTDRAPVALGHRLGVDGLVELAGLVALLDHPPVAAREQP